MTRFPRLSFLIFPLVFFGVFALLFNATPATGKVAGGITPTLANYLPIIIKPATLTATPTATATQPPPADVDIVFILYNPDGNDVTGEYIRLQNIGGSPADLTGWTLSDSDGREYLFPTNFVLAANATVQIWTKNGTNTTTDLYWGQNLGIWTNTGDTATLRNSSLQVIDVCSYSGGGTSTSCN